MTSANPDYMSPPTPWLVKAARTGRTIARVTPQSAGWRFVGFEALWLAPGELHEAQTGGGELCIVVIAGRVSVESGDLAWRDIGGRASPFEDVAPFAVYLPPGRDVRVTAHTDAEIALCSAPASKGFQINATASMRNTSTPMLAIKSISPAIAVKTSGLE